MFRGEAIAHHAGGSEEGDVLRFEKKWAVYVYRVIGLAAICSFLFICLFSVDEYAAGPAVVRVEGRRMLTATAPGNVEGIEVRPGQWVDVGAVLVRMYNVDEANELARAKNELDLQVIRMLRDPNDPSVKQTLAS